MLESGSDAGLYCPTSLRRRGASSSTSSSRSPSSSSRSPSPSMFSVASSASSASSPSTNTEHNPPSSPAITTQFAAFFQEILDEWRAGKIDDKQREKLNEYSFNEDDFAVLCSTFGLRRGMELENYKVRFRETTTGIHSSVADRITIRVAETYGLGHINSMSGFDLGYAPGNVKQPDACFAPRHLPRPGRGNHLLSRPGKLSGYPTFVFEVAVSNEDRERLLTDAEDKYFAASTDVNVWCGVKVKRTAAGTFFWAGWGRRKEIGYGLFLMEQTEDENNLATYFSTDNALQGEFQIPSTLIFKPLPVPPNVPAHFGLLFEDLRDAILVGASFDV